MADGITLRLKAVGARAVGADLKAVGDSAALMGTKFSVASAGVKASTAAMQALSLAFMAAPALIAGGVGVAIKKAIDYGDHLEKTAQKTGVAVESLSAYKLGAELAGTSQDGLISGLQRLQKNMGAALRSPTSAAAVAFKNLGMEFQNADGSLRDVDEMLPEIAENMRQMEDGTLKTQIAMDLMGRQGAELIPFLNQGADGLAAMREEAEALGIVFSQEDAVAAAQFNDALTRLGTTFNGFVQQATRAYLPTFLSIAEGANLAAREILGLNEAQKQRAAAVEAAQDAVNTAIETDESYRELLKKQNAVEDNYSEQGTQRFTQRQKQVLTQARDLGLLNELTGEAAEIVKQAAAANDNFNLVSAKKVDLVYQEFFGTVDLNKIVEERFGKTKEFIKEMEADTGVRKNLVKEINNENKSGTKSNKVIGRQIDLRKALVDQLRMQAEAQLRSIEMSLMSQEERLADSLKQQRDELFNSYEQNLISLERYLDLDNQLQLQYYGRLDEMRQRDVESERSANQKKLDEADQLIADQKAKDEKYRADQVAAAEAVLGSTASFAQSISQMVSATMGEESKEAKKAARVMFGIQQAVALADAGMSMAMAIGKANAAFPPPFNVPGIVAAAATGAAQIAAITAASISGVADAGLPPGALRSAGLNQHTVLAVRNDEMVLDPVGTAAISRMLEQRATGQGQPIMVNASVELDGEVLGRSVDNHLVRSSERGLGYERRIRY